MLRRNEQTNDTTGQDSEDVAETFALFIAGAHLTPNYVITPPMGDSKKGPLSRWFERKRLVSAEAVPGGVNIVAHKTTLTSRKINLEGLTTIAA